MPKDGPIKMTDLFFLLSAFAAMASGDASFIFMAFASADIPALLGDLSFEIR